jgi:hypothetical protein
MTEPSNGNHGSHLPPSRPAIRAMIPADPEPGGRACLWCGRSFEPRRGGQRQLFCRPNHRLAFHAAARRWAERAVAEGVLTIADLNSTFQRNVHVAAEASKRGWKASATIPVTADVSPTLVSRVLP